MSRLVCFVTRRTLDAQQLESKSYLAIDEDKNMMYGHLAGLL